MRKKVIASGIAAGLAILLNTDIQAMAGEVKQLIMDEGDLQYEITSNGTITIVDFDDYGIGADKLVIPDTIDGKKVTGIGDSAFAYVAASEIVLPDTIQWIGQEAFWETSELKKINIPDGITGIEYETFYCSGIESIELPDSVTYIDKSGFDGCENLSEVILSENLEFIGRWAFYGCTELSVTEIPESVTVIDAEAFYNCNKLESINIGKNVEKIDDMVFEDCDGLTEINVSKDNVNYSSQDGVLYNKDKTTLIKYPEGKDEQIFIIPDTVVQIESYAFTYCIAEKVYCYNMFCEYPQEAMWYQGTFCGYVGSTTEAYVEEFGNVDENYILTFEVIQNEEPLSIEARANAGGCVIDGEIVIMAGASGGSGEYTYSYLMYNVNAKTWTRLTPSFIEDNTYTWTGENAGNYRFYAEVKDKTGTVVRSAVIPVTVVEAPLLVSAVDFGWTEDTIGCKVSATGGSGDYSYALTRIERDVYNDAKKDIEYEFNNYESEYGSDNVFRTERAYSGDYCFTISVRDNVLGTVESINYDICDKNVKPYVTAEVQTEAMDGTRVTEVTRGDKLYFIADGNAGSGDYTYKFIMYNKDTKAWANLSGGFKESKTFAWTAGAAGNRIVYVDVKDGEGNVARSRAMEFYVKELAVTLEPETENRAYEIVPGDKVTITANASGGTGTYTYRYKVYNMDTDTWANLTGYISSNTFTWTAGSYGVRRFYVEVKDSAGNTKTGKASCVDVKTLKLDANIVVNNTNVTVGDKVSFTVNASGGAGDYTYQYWIYNCDTEVLAKLTGYVINNTYTWTAGSTGTRELLVYVKDSSGEVVEVYSENVYVNYPELELEVTTGENALVATEAVNIVAVATGGSGNYKYSYEVWHEALGWVRLATDTVNNRIAWVPEYSGEWQIEVRVKDSNENENCVYLDVTVGETEKYYVRGNSDATMVTKGNIITLHAEAVNGIGDCTYSYLVYNVDTKTWARLTPSFIEENWFDWTAGSVGNRRFYVEAKDSTGKVVRSSPIPVQVLEYLPLGGGIVADTQHIQKGGKVTFTVNAYDGSGGYTYRYYVTNDTTGETAYLTNGYVSSNTFTWTAGSVGDRTFYVDIKDSKGNVCTCDIWVETVDKLTLEDVEVTTAFGAWTNSVAIWRGTSYEIKFHVVNNGQAAWDNYMLTLSSCQDETAAGGDLAVFRADAYGWTPNGGFFMTPSLTDKDAWLEMMQSGGDCTIKLSYNEDDTFTYECTQTDGTQTYTMSYVVKDYMEEPLPDCCYFSLSGENCTITDITYKKL